MPCLGNTNPSQEISSLTGSLEITGAGEIVDFKGSDGTVPVYMCHKLVGKPSSDNTGTVPVL